MQALRWITAQINRGDKYGRNNFNYNYAGTPKNIRENRDIY